MGTSFKENLRELLDYRDITIKELAFMANVPKRSIENYLSARASMPPADYAYRIAKALGTSVEYLVNGQKPLSAPAVPPFPPDTAHLIKTYQSLPKNDKAVLQRIATALSRKTPL